MKCPECGGSTFVLYTRGLVNRRRACAKGHRFSTKEVTVSELALSRLQRDALSNTLIGK